MDTSRRSPPRQRQPPGDPMPWTNFHPDDGVRHLSWFENDEAVVVPSVMRGDCLDGLRLPLPVRSGPGDELVISIRTQAPSESFTYVRYRHTGTSENVNS